MEKLKESLLMMDNHGAQKFRVEHQYYLQISIIEKVEVWVKIKRRLLLGRKVMTNLDSRLKSRDITLPTKVCLVKAMAFPVVSMDVRVGL